MRAVWATLRGHRDLRLVLSAGVVSMTGDWMLTVGLAFHVYVLTGSTLASAGMLLAAFAPQVLLGSLAGVFVDRWDRRRTMIVTNVLLAAGLAPLLLVHSADQVWVVYVVMLWEGTVEQFFAPAEQALLPSLVPDHRLLTANALVGQSRDVARLVGSALGGVAVAAGGLTLLTLLDAASFVLAALLVSRVRSPGRTRGTADAQEAARGLTGRLRDVRSAWAEGLRVAMASHVVRVVAGFTLVTTVGEGIMGTLFAPFVHDAVRGDASVYGLIVSAQAVGGIVGGLVAAAAGERFRAERLFGWGAAWFGAVDLVLFLYPLAYPVAWPAVVCMLVVGIPGAFSQAGRTTLVQRATRDAHRGRLFGALGTLQAVAVVAGLVSAGFLGEAVGVIPILALQGVGYLVAGLAVVALLRARTTQRPPSETTGVGQGPVTP